MPADSPGSRAQPNLHGKIVYDGVTCRFGRVVGESPSGVQPAYHIVLVRLADGSEERVFLGCLRMATQEEAEQFEGAESWN